MRWKTTLLLLAVTVGLGTYLSRYELKQPPPEAREQLSKQVVDIPPETVSQLVLDLPQAKATLALDGTTWRLAPAQVRADPILAQRILAHLAPLTAERVLPGTGDRKTFGLEPAAGWLTVVAGGTPTTLFIGDTTPVQHNRYLSVAGRAAVYVVPAALFDDANQPSAAFRDTALIPLSPWMTDRLTVTSPTLRIAVRREQARWLMTQPVGDRADRSQVNALLTALSGIRISRFVEDAPQVEHLATWGFDQPKAEVALHLEDGQAVTLFFGAPLPEDRSLVYAKRSDEPGLYAVAAADVEGLLPPSDALREHTCFDFFLSHATKLEVARGEQRWTVARTSAASQWRVEGANTAVDTARVEALLNKLADVRVSGFEDEAPADLARYGLETPAGSITVWAAAEDPPQRLRIGSVVGTSSDRYGRIEGRPPVVRLSETVTQLLATTIEQLQPPSPSALPPQAGPSVTTERK